MLTGIDHLVIVVQDLESAMQNYGELGFTMVRGGKHPIGSHNALIAFEDGSYIEFIAFYEPNTENRWWAHLQAGGGLVDCCAQTDDLKADVKAFREVGVDIADIMPLSRLRPDGYKIEWVLSLARGKFQGVVPFLIEDRTPREERVPGDTTHANQVTGIDTLTVAVDDPDAVRGWYRPVLGMAGETIERPDLDARGVRFRIGLHTLDFVTPHTKDGTGPLNDRLRDRGSSPFAFTLKTRSGATGPLDETRTLGARVALVE